MYSAIRGHKFSPQMQLTGMTAAVSGQPIAWLNVAAQNEAVVPWGAVMGLPSSDVIPGAIVEPQIDRFRPADGLLEYYWTNPWG